MFLIVPFIVYCMNHSHQGKFLVSENLSGNKSDSDYIMGRKPFFYRMCVVCGYFCLKRSNNMQMKYQEFVVVWLYGASKLIFVGQFGMFSGDESIHSQNGKISLH